MPLTSNPARYEVVPGLRVASFDDESVVFNPSSWETHVLNPSASLVLDAIASAPRTESEVLELLAEALDEADRSRAPEHARRLLGDLVQLRLLRPPPDECNAGR